MMRARARALLIVSLLIVAALAIAAVVVGREPSPLPPRPAAKRPTLLLLTGLPLMFGKDFSLQQTGSPALKALQTRYRVVPISVADPAELAKGRLLLMAQPLAQPAEDLVALDEWVRRGGRVLLLADPMLEAAEPYLLGDPLRPPTMFMDTGLLAHWGLRLDAPDKRVPRETRLGGFKVVTPSPGQLFGGCRISRDRITAECRIGKGKAIVVADADFIEMDGLGDAATHNLDGLLAELAQLEHP
jgi:hypothetical protein